MTDNITFPSPQALAQTKPVNLKSLLTESARTYFLPAVILNISNGVAATGQIEAHAIPTSSLDVSAFSGIIDAPVYINLDISSTASSGEIAAGSRHFDVGIFVNAGVDVHAGIGIVRLSKADAGGGERYIQRNLAVHDVQLVRRNKLTRPPDMKYIAPIPDIFAFPRHTASYLWFRERFFVLRNSPIAPRLFTTLSDFLRSAGQREYRFAVPAYAIEEHAPPTMLRRARAQAVKVAASVESEGGQSLSFTLRVCLRLLEAGKHL
ncbi:hypothetical protein C8R44DRAFT_742707 [Mycena epipterygia]|nr:hypothetical protein C8R44DRAFT_742707 [Mycena epipterygia]